jgi:uncharacterized SAM-binding protein YcdF (DUF218 family)
MSVNILQAVSISEQKKDIYDALIVPGYPTKTGNWNFRLKKRILWAVYLYKTGKVKNLIFSGSAVYTPYIEAKIMALYAQKLGVPPEHIFIENEAEHSCENLYYSYVMAKRLGFKKVALTSGLFHCMFIEKFRKRFDIPVDIKPVKIAVFLRWKRDLHIDPLKAYQDGFVSLVDRKTKEERKRASMGERVVYNYLFDIMNTLIN